MFARTVDPSDQRRQRHLPGMRDCFQVSPEGIFKANAGLVSIMTTERLTIKDFIGTPEHPAHYGNALRPDR
jgi:hypothetical protein